MAKKKKVEKPRHEPTRRQLSRWKKHQRRQRIIFASGILIIVAVLAVVGAGAYFGWYVPERQPLHETVIKVNDTEFSMDYYVKTLKYQILELESFGITVQIEQMPYLAEGAVKAIQSNELVREAALALGISVSDEELAARVDEELGSYDPSLIKGYQEVVRDMVRGSMLMEKLRDEYFDQQVPQTAEQRHIMAMFLESQSQANEVKARLEAGELFSELAGELSLDSYCKSQKGDLGWHPRGILPMLIDSSVLEDSAFSAEVRTLSQPIYEETKVKGLGYWLIEVKFVDAEVEHADVRVILLGSEEVANEVRARLEAGEDFAALAKEFSQHADSKDEGGEFEINAKGLFGAAFDEFVFNPELELETLSPPIKDDTVVTEGGYWLIKVTEAEGERPILEEDRNSLKMDALNKWMEALPDDPANKVESYLDDAKKDWAIMRAWEG